MLKFIALTLKYNLSAHLSNLPNLVAAASGMLINNTIYLLGMWGMIFSGKSQNDTLIIYYIAVQALIMTSWGGGLTFFLAAGWI